MKFLIYALLTVHVMVCVLMVLTVLMQRPRNEGLGAAFGGGMTDNIFGAQTTNVLAKFTTWLGGAFFVLTLVLAMLFARTSSPQASQITEELMSMPEPAAAVDKATETPAPAAEATEPAATEAEKAPAESAPPTEAPTADPSADAVETFEAVAEDAPASEPAAETTTEAAESEAAVPAGSPTE